MQKRTILHQKFSNFEIIITIFILLTVLVFEVMPNTGFSPIMIKVKSINKTQKNHNMFPTIIYKRPENWLYGDLDLLISAQKLGYLKSDPSGFEEYLNVRAKNLHHGDTTTTKNDSEKK